MNQGSYRKALRPMYMAMLIFGSVWTGQALAQKGPTWSSFETGYRVTNEIPLPGNESWDHPVVDSAARRLYVSHGDVVQVLNADSGRLIGEIQAPNTASVAIASEFRRGFSSNGADKSITIFDTDTLATIKTVKLVVKTDVIVYDPFTKRVFPMGEKVPAIDAQTGDVAGTVNLDAEPEEAISDGKGALYVNEADKNAVAVINPKTLAVTKTYPIKDCTSPRSLAFDPVNERLFVGCLNGFFVVDAPSGKVISQSLICGNVDGSAFDSENKLVFESCYDGVIFVIRQMTPDIYLPAESIPTKLRASTMAFDPKTKNLYLPTVDLQFAFQPPYKLKKPGSFRVLVVSRN